jgi:hypothetical protein
VQTVITGGANNKTGPKAQSPKRKIKTEKEKKKKGGNIILYYICVNQSLNCRY